MRSTWFSRPKKRCSSSVRNGRRPGYGLLTPAERSTMTGLQERSYERLDEVFGETTQAVDQIRLTHVNGVSLGRSGWLGQPGEHGGKWPSGPQCRGFANIAVHARLPCLCAAAVEYQHGVAAGQALLVGLA